MEFDVKFKRCKLGDLVDISSSKRIFAKEYRDYGVPFYRSKEIIEKSSNQEISKPLYISEDKYEDIKSQFGVPQKGDLLLTSVGTLGIPYIVKNNDKFYFKDGNLTWFKNFNGLDNLFLYYWFLSPPGKKQIYGKHIGSTQKALTITNLKSFDLLIPTLDIQKNISKILYYFDKKIEINNKIIENLEAQAQSIFKSWFVDFDPFQKGNFVESELGLIPEGWNSGTIKSLDIKVSDHVANGSFKSLKENVNIYEDENYALFLRNVDLKYNLNSSKRWVDEKSYNFLKKTQLFGGEVIISNVGNVGNVYLVPYTNKPMVIGNNLIYIDSGDSNVNIYLYELFRSYQGKKLIKSITSGSVQQKFNKTDFRKLKIVLPPSNYLSKLKKFNDSISSLIRQNQILAQTRDTLLPKLMSGEIDVSNIKIDDEDTNHE